jgi:hypothetical protein
LIEVIEKSSNNIEFFEAIHWKREIAFLAFIIKSFMGLEKKLWENKKCRISCDQIYDKRSYNVITLERAIVILLGSFLLNGGLLWKFTKF